MTLKELLAKLKTTLTGTTDEAEKARIKAQIEELETVEPDPSPTPAPTPTPVPTPASTDQEALGRVVSEAVKQAMAPVLKELEESKKANTILVAAQEAKAAADNEAKVKTLLDEAVGDGRVPADKRDTWKTRAEKDFDGTKEILAEMPKNPAVNRGKTATPPVPGEKAETPHYETKMARMVRPEVMAHIEKSEAQS